MKLRYGNVDINISGHQFIFFITIVRHLVDTLIEFIFLQLIIST